MARFGKAMSDENKPAETLTGLYKTSIKGGNAVRHDGRQLHDLAGCREHQQAGYEGPTANMATTGNINLPAWTLATNHEISMPKISGHSAVLDQVHAGSLDNPGQTFGRGLIQDYLQRKASKKLQGVLADKLGDKAGGALGSLLGLPQKQAAPVVAPVVQPAPVAEQAPAQADEQAAGDEAARRQVEAAPVQEAQPEAAPAEPAEKREVTPEDALQGVLENLIQKN